MYPANTEGAGFDPSIFGRPPMQVSPAAMTTGGYVAPPAASLEDQGLYAVVLFEQKKIYGPFYDKLSAEKFAGFLTYAVDPAVAVRLFDPMDEMLAFFAGTQKEVQHEGPGSG